MSYTLTEKSGRSGSWDITAGRKHTRIYEVISPIINDTEYGVTSIVNVPGIPVRGEIHPIDHGSIVTNIAAQQNEKEPFLWRVQIDYQSRPHFPWGTQGQSPSNQPENPLSRLPIVEYSVREETVYVQKDLSGPPKALINTAGQPYPEGVAIIIDVPIISIDINKSVGSGLNFADFASLVNSDSWTFNAVTYGPNEVKAKSPAVTSHYDNNVAYWNWKWHIEIAPEGPPYFGLWIPSYILSQGYYERLATGKIRQLKDKDGLALTKPGLLDAAGLSTTTPYYQEYTLYESDTFTGSVP